MKRVVSQSILTSALAAEFSVVFGLRAQTFVVAAVRSACKVAGVKPADVPHEELRAMLSEAVQYLRDHGVTPCKAGGEPMTDRELQYMARDAFNTLSGKDKARKAARARESKAAAPAGEISATVDADKKPQFVAPVLPQSGTVTKMRELAEAHKGDKGDFGELAKLVLEFFAA